MLFCSSAIPPISMPPPLFFDRNSTSFKDFSQERVLTGKRDLFLLKLPKYLVLAFTTQLFLRILFPYLQNRVWEETNQIFLLLTPPFSVAQCHTYRRYSINICCMTFIGLLKVCKAYLHSTCHLFYLELTFRSMQDLQSGFCCLMRLLALPPTLYLVN